MYLCVSQIFKVTQNPAKLYYITKVDPPFVSQEASKIFPSFVSVIKNCVSGSPFRCLLLYFRSLYFLSNFILFVKSEIHNPFIGFFLDKLQLQITSKKHISFSLEISTWINRWVYFYSFRNPPVYSIEIYCRYNLVINKSMG